MSLKKIIGEFNLDLFLKKQKFDTEVKSDEVKGIGILFSAESLLHQQSVTQFYKTLQRRYQENIHLFGYVPKKLENQVTFAFPHFSLSDVSIRPDFSRHKLALFMQRRYRVCINLDVDNHKIIHYIMAKTTALNKMGISPDYPALYNIIVKRDEQDELAFIIEKTLDIFEKTLAI